MFEFSHLRTCSEHYIFLPVLATLTQVWGHGISKFVMKLKILFVPGLCLAITVPVEWVGRAKLFTCSECESAEHLVFLLLTFLSLLHLALVCYRLAGQWRGPRADKLCHLYTRTFWSCRKFESLSIRHSRSVLRYLQGRPIRHAWFSSGDHAWFHPMHPLPLLTPPPPHLPSPFPSPPHPPLPLPTSKSLTPTSPPHLTPSFPSPPRPLIPLPPHPLFPLLTSPPLPTSTPFSPPDRTPLPLLTSPPSPPHLICPSHLNPFFPSPFPSPPNAYSFCL